MANLFLNTPIGSLRAEFTEAGALCRLQFAKERSGEAADEPAALRAQVEAYFRGEQPSFDVPLALEGQAFERKVWQALQTVPYGTTTTYGALAARLGAPGAAQAVGRACAANPVLIVVPCHRVTGAGGELAGYAGGVERKAALLRHEGALLV